LSDIVQKAENRLHDNTSAIWDRQQAEKYCAYFVILLSGLCQKDGQCYSFITD